MDIKIDPDWWKTLFDDIYLLTDARTVCDDDITRLEVNVICELIPLQTESRILDLCGGHGRHSLELLSRGFSSCTLLDYSQHLIHRAKAKASECNAAMDFVLGDARDVGFLNESFDHVFIMGNSLGYIQEPDGDRRIIKEAYRLLRSGGWFLIDVADGDAVKQSFNPSAWHEIGDDMVVCRWRKLEKNSIHAREMILSKEKGLIRDQNYAIRLYGLKTLSALMEEAGFRKVDVRTGFSPHKCSGDYGFMNHRMLVTGQKL
ncbi:MAG: class I SAM-dependent methyltransferase [Desulfobacterales bacterium]